MDRPCADDHVSPSVTIEHEIRGCIQTSDDIRLSRFDGACTEQVMINSE